ncbi:HAD family hydrolase [Sphingomonas nostoxanthinifaciens]|uniref:HAD family hydrolase n=1 Tax=Sphingomonas nostoxanthinifaciens TaxID=2872652 RepID=UPI0021D83496|nr:HAD family hydrolase [Sphingomonas nostoxanthinifaciens]UAK25736.1 HAD family hydrolase [Sphingomonas nostoxanthinifaciens]
MFDIDGTLIDSNDLHVKAWDRAFREHGHNVSADAILGQIGKGGDKLVPALLPDIDEAEQKKIDDRHGAIFKAEYLNEARPFPRASDLLRRVHADGRKVVLASSAKKAELDHYVKLLGVADVIDAATSIDDVDQSKPAPDIFATALEKANVAADRALVIGDTVWDIEAAKKNGIPTLGLLSGGILGSALRQAGAIVVYADVASVFDDYARLMPRAD